MAATMSETLLKKAGEFPTFDFPMISADLFPLKFKQRRRGARRKIATITSYTQDLDTIS